MRCSLRRSPFEQSEDESTEATILITVLHHMSQSHAEFVHANIDVLRMATELPGLWR